MPNSRLFFLFTVLTILNYVQAQGQSSPGDISTNAKVLDVDRMEPFSDGVALIGKGKATALIDANGNYVVPFGKYNIEKVGKGGLIEVTCLDNSSGKGLINSKGMILLPCNPKNTTAPYFIFDEPGYARVVGSGSNEFFINAKGEKIILNPGATSSIKPSTYREGLGAFSQNRKYGYADHSGKTIIVPQFDEAGVFSEGMAIVGKRNEFGEMKYGFVDRTGKMVIPFQYSKRPKNFSNGLAGVEPVKKEDFIYAYINKKGEVVIKIDKGLNGNKFWMSNSGAPDFTNGYVEWSAPIQNSNNVQHYLFDTTGKMVKIEDFLKGFGIEASELSGIPVVALQKHGMWRVNRGSATNRRSGSGRVNLKTGKTLPFVFRNLDTEYYDPVSRLTYAEVSLDYPADKKIRRGYINEDGVFVIVQGEGSVF